MINRHKSRRKRREMREARERNKLRGQRRRSRRERFIRVFEDVDINRIELPGQATPLFTIMPKGTICESKLFGWMLRHLHREYTGKRNIYRVTFEKTSEG